MSILTKNMRVLAVVAAGTLSLLSTAQEKEGIYFIDGFHGGVYGHYPMKTYTDYMSGLIEKYPDWRMCLEIEPETWDTVKVVTPEAYERFRETVKSDRVEFTNPTYAQPYMYNISGESIIRQFRYGIDKIHSHFPHVEFVTYAVEEPCFTSALPQILKQFGFKYASLKCPNTCWGGYSAPFGGELVNWIGPDGSSVLTSPRYACESLQEGSVWQTIAWGNKDEYIDACRKAGIKNIAGMCYQDAGWTYGPWIGYGDSVRNGSEYVTWREYFEEKTAGKTSDDYHFSQEDIRPALMWGSQVLQVIARQVRHTENNLVRTEKAGLIASLSDGFRYEKEDMDEAWRTLMLAQHHDSWIVPYNRLNDRGSWADNIALWTASSDRICDGIMHRMILGADPDISGNEPFGIRIINTAGHARKEAVSVLLPNTLNADYVCVRNQDGQVVESVVDSSRPGRRTLLFMAEVPSFGYAVYSVSPAVVSKEIKKSGCSPASGLSACEITADVVVETDFYRIVLDSARGGIIKSLIAKKEGGKEFAETSGKYGINEIRGYFYDCGKFISSADSPASVCVNDLGLVKEVEVKGAIGSVPFVQKISLRNGDRKIDVSLKIDWKGNEGVGKFAQGGAFADNERACYNDRYKLNVMFPVSVDNAVLYKNAPFDVCRSALDNTFFDTWDNIKHNVILDWVDIAGDGDKGFAIFSDHTTSYSFGDGYPLALTAQYSGGGLWGRMYPITGPSEISYAFFPHFGKWDSAGIEAERGIWSEPLVCALTEKPEATSVSYMDLSGTGYEISAAYMTDAGAEIRLYNASGDDTPAEITFGFPVKEVMEVDLMDNKVSDCRLEDREGRKVMKASMPRFGFRTYRIVF